MNDNNRNLIVDKRAAKKHERKLKTILSAFFDFLSKKPKPADEEVRTEFQCREIEWKAYCLQNHLDIRTSLMFNAKVSYEWERKYIKDRMRTKN